MKYQLIGRKRAFVKSSYKDIEQNSPFLLLPHEVLLDIFEYLKEDITSLTSLSQACRKLYILTCKSVIYKQIIFKNADHFIKFRKEHLPHSSRSIARRFPGNEPSKHINFIEGIILKNPPSRESQNERTTIAGSYDISDVKALDTRNQYEDFVEALTVLMQEAFGLKKIEISEFSSTFEFPNNFLEYARHSAFSKKLGSRRQLKSLTLTSQTGWTIPFKYSQIYSFSAVFDTICELHLERFTIESSLSQSSFPLPVKIEKLVLDSCIYSQTLGYRQQSHKVSIFSHVSELVLLNVPSSADLSIIDFIKSNNKLTKLSIDLGSKVFYKNSASQKIFNFARFNLFFKLLCSGQNAYRNMNELELINFDFYKYHNHASDDSSVQDSWVERDDTLEMFLKYISSIKNLTLVLRDNPTLIHTCLKCGFIKSKKEKDSIHLLERVEWIAFLEPLFQENNMCNVKIQNRKGIIIHEISKHD